ncbi:hypothetical protein TNCV_2428041 [Trichonephila clavipes]|nr:hypothetical protein TNCV_2428041 [Trichonephila clavipes]
MTGTDNSFPATSIPSLTLSIISSGEKWPASLSAKNDQMFSKFDKSADCTSLGNNRTPNVFTPTQEAERKVYVWTLLPSQFLAFTPATNLDGLPRTILLLQRTFYF